MRTLRNGLMALMLVSCAALAGPKQAPTPRAPRPSPSGVRVEPSPPHESSSGFEEADAEDSTEDSARDDAPGASSADEDGWVTTMPALDDVPDRI